jgi:hypothetical protein
MEASIPQYVEVSIDFLTWLLASSKIRDPKDSNVKNHRFSEQSFEVTYSHPHNIILDIIMSQPHSSWEENYMRV